MKKHFVFEIPMRWRFSDAGIGIYLILNDDYDGKISIGFFVGALCWSYCSNRGFHFCNYFVTGTGG